MAGVARFLLAGGVSLAVHAALLVGTCGGWFAGGAAAAAREEVDVAVQLEVGSVDLSVAEEEDASAPAAAQPVAAPSAPVPPPPAAVPEPPPLTAPPEPDAVVVRADDAVRPTALRPPEPEPPEPEPPEPEPAARPPAPAPAPPAVAAPVQARVDAPPTPRKSIKPKYPEGARRRGEQGDVVLELAVDARGGVADVKVVGGCGFAELEHAAVSAARRARFRPARRGGASVPSSARLTLTFWLRD